MEELEKLKTVLATYKEEASWMEGMLRGSPPVFQDRYSKHLQIIADLETTINAE